MGKKFCNFATIVFLFVVLSFSVTAFAAYSDISLYIERPAAEAGNRFYSGGKYEPKVGSLLGMFAEGDEAVHNPWTGSPFYFDGVPELTGKKHAMYMIYLHYGVHDFNHYLSHYNKAKGTGVGMQISLEPISGLESVVDGDYLRTFARQAKDTGLPIILRFANEMNDGSNPWGNKDPELYKEKFRLVAKIMREEAPNVAMCWSPNDWPFDNSSDKYYPGDEYVDWVGVSSYPPYTSNTKSKHNTKFTDRIKHIYDKYAARKPILLSEGAPIQNIEFEEEPSVTYVAAKEVKEFYDEIARKYPKIKAVFYWSNEEDYGAKRKCKLSTNPTVLAAYKKAIESPYFLKEVDRLDSTIYFADVSNTVVQPEMQKLSAFVALNGRLDIGKVAYKINGQYVGEKTGSPYEISVDFKAYEGQTVKILADVYSENGSYISSKTITAKVGGNLPVPTPKVVTTSTGIKIVPSNHNITLNGEKVEIPCYNINGNNFFKLRDLGVVMNQSNSKFDVGYDEIMKKITLQKGNSYSGVNRVTAKVELKNNPNVQVSPQSLIISNKEISGISAYLVDGNNYFKLADLAKHLNFTVNWNGQSNTIELEVI